MRRLSGAVAVALAVVSPVLAGCGDDAATPSGPTVAQRVTRDFGRELLSKQDHAPLRGHRTAMRLLTEYHDVGAGWGGSIVESIDGREQDTAQGTPLWVLNVNGIEADEHPPRYPLYPGDVVQWDLRKFAVRLDVRATVGAFPETFSRGVFGKRFPVRLRCAVPASSACADVRRKLRDAGVRTDGSPPPGGLPPGNQPQRASVFVGPWDELGRTRWADRIDVGPGESGVFARFSPDARKLQLLDPSARLVRAEGAGTGLIGAMRPTEQDLRWFVTGVDGLGVRRAAAALDSDRVRDAFAVAVTDDGVERLPLPPR